MPENPAESKRAGQKSSKGGTIIMRRPVSCTKRFEIAAGRTYNEKRF
jgi:hypothetical protein